MRLFCVLFLALASVCQAADKPIQALLVTGGCCHDYDRQKLILTRGISARANVRWTVVHQGGKTTDTKIPLYEDPNWAEGFDIVVHNECFAHVKDKEFVDNILKPHREGLPAILIHCAMHCYRVGDDSWFEFVGLRSHNHGAHYSYTANNLKPDHAIMQGFGDMFVTPKGELYNTVDIFDTCTPLAQANRKPDDKPQVCVWTNDYRGTKVFGTTIGHYNETMVEPKYLDMLAKGLLWAVGRDPEKDFTPATQKVEEEIKALVNVEVNQGEAPATELPQNCCGEENLAFGKPVTSKSEQSSNWRRHLTDGKLNTRWCASGGQTNEWVTVDLEQPKYIRSIRLHWERRNGTAYLYTIETSADNDSWKTVVDETENKDKNGIRQHKVDAPDTRYIRITFHGSSTNGWGSIWELEASEGELPELSKIQAAPESTAAVSDVEAPEGFDVTMFGAPPEVNYPVCLTTSAAGEVFVGVDEQGSLGKEPGRGKVLRCVDTDGDGQADQINEFAKMDHPRGLIYDNGSLWVLHPPFLSLYQDTNGDGTADRSEVLIEGISTDEVNKRGADHTTNGIRMGIDGWIYIAVGDFGFNKAVAKDGTTLSKRGGGVVRIRPDGTEMEIYSWGQRNILDVAIDPYMNMFTRDNTNDGGGWDIRLSHVMQTANYGYPSLYINFTEESMPALADYGGGSGCGVMYLYDERWPEGFNDLALTCDWGRSEVFSHNLPQHGATYDAQQDTFLKIPRPTDIDVDPSGRMYVSSWKGGKFAYDGPNIGFVAQVTPHNYVPHPVPDVHELNDKELVYLLNHPSAAMKLTVQRELIRRGHKLLQRQNGGSDATAAVSTPGAMSADDVIGPALYTLIENNDATLAARVAAIYTLKQIQGARAHGTLAKLAEDKILTEHCLRALADRRSQFEALQITLFLDSLNSSNPRIQAAAIIGLNRIGGHARRNNWVVSQRHQEHAKADFLRWFAKALLPLTVRTEERAETQEPGDAWRQPDAGRVIPHLAVQALAEIEAVPSCLEALNGPYRYGALWALKQMHSKEAVDGLFTALSKAHEPALRREIWTALIRLYHQEGEFTTDSPKWWGTRPDTTGPYYDRQKWSQSERIGEAIKVALGEADETLAKHLREQLKRHVVRLDGVSGDDIAAMREPEKAITIPTADPNNPNQIANMDYVAVLDRCLKLDGDPAQGRELFRAQSCINCHTFANGQLPKGPHLVDIGKRYKKEELIESIVQPNKKIAQGFDTWAFVTTEGKIYTGFVVLESAETVTIRQNDGLSKELLQDDIDERVKQETSMMPKGIAGNLTPEQLADLIAYLQTLR